jgi:hypothetical protein
MMQFHNLIMIFEQFIVNHHELVMVSISVHDLNIMIH